MGEWFERIIAGLVAAIGGFFWYWVKSNDRKHSSTDSRFKEVFVEMSHIKDDFVTRDTITRIENDWRDEITLLREERKEERQETRQALADIKRTIDENESRDSKTRHEVRDSVHAIAVQIATLNGRHGMPRASE